MTKLIKEKRNVHRGHGLPNDLLERTNCLSSAQAFNVIVKSAKSWIKERKRHPSADSIS